MTERTGQERKSEPEAKHKQAEGDKEREKLIGLMAC
jgi:hypothetical protein